MIKIEKSYLNEKNVLLTYWF